MELVEQAALTQEIKKQVDRLNGQISREATGKESTRGGRSTAGDKSKRSRSRRERGPRLGWKNTS